MKLLHRTALAPTKKKTGASGEWELSRRPEPAGGSSPIQSERGAPPGLLLRAPPPGEGGQVALRAAAALGAARGAKWSLPECEGAVAGGTTAGEDRAA